MPRLSLGPCPHTDPSVAVLRFKSASIPNPQWKDLLMENDRSDTVRREDVQIEKQGGAETDKSTGSDRRQSGTSSGQTRSR